MTIKEQVLAEVDRLRAINDTIHCPDPSGEEFATGIRKQIEEVASKIVASVSPLDPVSETQ